MKLRLGERGFWVERDNRRRHGLAGAFAYDLAQRLVAEVDIERNDYRRACGASPKIPADHRTTVVVAVDLQGLLRQEGGISHGHCGQPCK